MVRSNLLSRRDLDFLLYEWLDVEKLTKRPRFAEHSREIFDDLLDLSERIADRAVRAAQQAQRPRGAHPSTARPCTSSTRSRDALRVFAEAGLVGGAMDTEVGGMQLPQVVATASFAWFTAANVGTSAYPLLTIGNANLLLAHGSQQQIDDFVLPMIEGRFYGTMCLSEPQAGSSLSDVTTRADPQADGTYRLFGNKMWISGGDHELSENIVHLVLAKIPGAPARREGHLAVHRAQVPGRRGRRARRAQRRRARRAEPQDGLPRHHQRAAQLRRGRYQPGGDAGAVGYLVGEPNRGLAYMFHMMNEARIGVGAGRDCAGLHRLPASRSSTRATAPQGRPVGGQGPDAAAGADHRARRTSGACCWPRSPTSRARWRWSCTARKLVDEERHRARREADRERAHLLLEVLTPIAKSWPSQWCLAANDLAIQVHGGYGYTREYPVEQFYRDNRLNPIHEGTHGIQGLDLLGRKVIMQRRRRAARCSPRPIAATIASAPRGGRPGRRARRAARAASLARVGEVTATALEHRRPRARAGQLARLPGGRRSRRGRLALAGAGARGW